MHGSLNLTFLSFGEKPQFCSVGAAKGLTAVNKPRGLLNFVKRQNTLLFAKLFSDHNNVPRNFGGSPGLFS